MNTKLGHIVRVHGDKMRGERSKGVVALLLVEEVVKSPPLSILFSSSSFVQYTCIYSLCIFLPSLGVHSSSWPFFKVPKRPRERRQETPNR